MALRLSQRPFGSIRIFIVFQGLAFVALAILDVKLGSSRTPEQIAKIKGSAAGRYLRNVLEKKRSLVLR